MVISPKWLKLLTWNFLRILFGQFRSKWDTFESNRNFSTFAIISVAFKKSQNLKYILDKSLQNKKVVFLHKNNSFLGFRTQKLILRVFWPKIHVFRHFRLAPPVFQSLLWPPHTRDFAQKHLKSTEIGKQKNSESFV